MNAKEILLDVAAKLAPEASLTDTIYELEFLQVVEPGLAGLDRGEVIPIEEAEAARVPRLLDETDRWRTW